MAVISHAHKFVFIKTVKTGGTAIETCLSKILPDSDILTPIFPDEGLGHIARNYKNEKGIFYNHMPARKVIELLGNNCKNYFFWCVEREPIDKCLSHYAMLKNSPHHGKNAEITWEIYLKRASLPMNVRKYFDRPHKLTFRKKILVDQIFDYHSIKEILPIFLQENFGIQGFNLKNSTAKSGFRDKSIPTIDEVCQEHRELIYRKFMASNKICREFGINYSIDSM